MPSLAILSDQLQTIDTAAILDMKWLHPRTELLSVATADSAVTLYRYENPEAGPRCLRESQRHILNSTKALCLSLDWSDRMGGYVGGYSSGQPEGTSGIVSQSDGTLAHISNLNVLEYASIEQGKMANVAIETWHAHDYEAWIAAFDCWSAGRIVWSGGDDLTLKGWDVRTPIRQPSSSSNGGSSSDGDGDGNGANRTPTFTHKKSFEGGVTSLQSHHLVEHLWAVGSYDSHVRLFDARKPGRPLSTTNVGGGVWRLKWHPSEADKLLVGCMHDGFKVLRLDALSGRDDEHQSLCHGSPFRAWEMNNSLPQEEMTILARFDEHESLAYGCDWDRGLNKPLHEASGKPTNQGTVYSCSFYDARMHAWQGVT